MATLLSCRVRNQFLKMRDETNHKNRNEVYFEVTCGTTRSCGDFIAKFAEAAELKYTETVLYACIRNEDAPVSRIITPG